MRRYLMRYQERVEEAESGLAAGDAKVVQQRDDSGERRRRAACAGNTGVWRCDVI